MIKSIKRASHVARPKGQGSRINLNSRTKKEALFLFIIKQRVAMQVSVENAGKKTSGNSMIKLKKV